MCWKGFMITLRLSIMSRDLYCHSESHKSLEGFISAKMHAFKAEKFVVKSTNSGISSCLFLWAEENQDLWGKGSTKSRMEINTMENVSMVGWRKLVKMRRWYTRVCLFSFVSVMMCVCVMCGCCGGGVWLTGEPGDLRGFFLSFFHLSQTWHSLTEHLRSFKMQCLCVCLQFYYVAQPEIHIKI